jgi:hypothetical protein
MTAPPKEDLFYRGKWLWMWPNWTLSLFAGGMNVSRINPVGPHRTDQHYHFFFADTSDAAAPSRAKIGARHARRRARGYPGLRRDPPQLCRRGL